MRGDLVQQKHGGHAAHGGHQPRMGQNKAGEQRFLFACGTVPGGLALGSVPHQ